MDACALLANERAGPPEGRASGGLSRRAIARLPIAILPRTLDPGVAAALDAMSEAEAPSFRLKGRRPAVLHGVGRELKSGLMPRWLADWLTSDIGFLAGVYCDVTGATIIEIRLQAVLGRLCPKFHADDNRFRLVTTYRGPVTEWLDDGSGVPCVRRLPRGGVALMRGARAATKAACADAPVAARRRRRIEAPRRDRRGVNQPHRPEDPALAQASSRPLDSVNNGPLMSAFDRSSGSVGRVESPVSMRVRQPAGRPSRDICVSNWKSA